MKAKQEGCRQSGEREDKVGMVKWGGFSDEDVSGQHASRTGCKVTHIYNNKLLS